ncbi:hypothetical protein McPS_33400 [Marichromatium sp. PS1]|uniref:transposase family protein n=1 Tax=Marichromatium sp. PS1 TaxID=3138932 RepID=UPI0032E5464E
MSETPIDISLVAHFSILEDPRCPTKHRHLLSDMVVIAVAGTLCGADSWTEIAWFGEAKQEWLEQFLALPNGIP